MPKLSAVFASSIITCSPINEITSPQRRPRLINWNMNGWVKVVQHREIESKSAIKTVTILKTPSGEYFVSILVEYENQVLKVIPRNIVGLDYSMKELYVSSDGEIP